MNYRRTTIFAPADLGTAGTKTIDINIKDVISRMILTWRNTNVTVSAMLAPTVDCISKIELVDGSEVIASMSGAEAQAMDFYDTGVMPYNALNLTVGGYFAATLNLNFGKYLFDPDLALDPKRFTNLQLKVTWNEDANNTSAVVNQFAVYADVFDEKAASPTGYLMNKALKQYAMAASSHEYIDFPQDYPLRKLLIRGYSTDHDPIALFDTLKISENTDKRVPLDMKAEQYYWLLKGKYPQIEEKVTLDAVVTAKTIYATVSRDVNIHINYDATAFVTAQSKFAEPTYTGALLALSASVDIKADTASISGDLPHNCIPVVFGDQQNKADWYDLKKAGDVQADLLSSSDADSGDTTYLVLQQLKTY